jgi:hypothetical protein
LLEGVDVEPVLVARAAEPSASCGVPPTLASMSKVPPSGTTAGTTHWGAE